MLNTAPYISYGTQVFRDLMEPNEMSVKVTDLYFPKMAMCQFLTHGPGGDLNAS